MTEDQFDVSFNYRVNRRTRRSRPRFYNVAKLVQLTSGPAGWGTSGGVGVGVRDGSKEVDWEGRMERMFQRWRAGRHEIQDMDLTELMMARAALL